MLKDFAERFYYWAEYIVEVYLVPKDGPGPFFKLWFKQPILYYKLGLGPLIARQVLLLTTIGRKSGKQRVTPLGYSYRPAEWSYYISAGWDGHTDWYRNLEVNPKAQVQVGGLRFDCVAEFLSVEERIELVRDYTGRNPLAKRIWERWMEAPFDGSEASLRLAARHFPAVRLRMR